jgi:transposase
MEIVGKIVQSATRTTSSAEAPMLSHDQWATIRTLAGRGIPKKVIARKLGIDAKTVRRYLRQGGRVPYRRGRPMQEALEQELGAFLRRRAPEVDFCAQVLFQEVRAQGFPGSYPTVMRWVRPLRSQARRLEVATVRFETGPGRQSQVDWASLMLQIAAVWVRVHLFVMTLGFSRRIFARAYPNERLAALLDGHERAFAHFGGRTEELLYDNPRTIVSRRDREGKHIEWNPTFRDFADYYGFRPRLCRPYRARTKGKVERAVQYVKGNALKGRSFRSWDHLNEWLATWTTTVADVRVHGTTHEVPAERFRQETLRPITGVAPYRIEQNPRTVASDCLVTLHTNRYSVPWSLVGERVEIAVVQHQVHILQGGSLLAAHPLSTGRHQVVRNPEHFRGLFRSETAARPRANGRCGELLWPVAVPDVEVRDLAVYEALVTGGAR